MSDAEPLLVRGGLLADGTGAALREADVLLERGRGAAVAAPGAIAGDGRRVLDAVGWIVAPGFIDGHSHADNAPLLDEDDTTKILQGVTAEVVGNCGFSLGPVVAERADDLRRLLERLFSPQQLRWASTAELFDALAERGSVTSWAPLVGHKHAAGRRRRHPRPPARRSRARDGRAAARRGAGRRRVRDLQRADLPAWTVRLG